MLPRYDARARENARIARKRSSVAEQVMWEQLRNKKTGFRFRREQPYGRYRLDFYCHEARLAVEMDGEQHDPVADAVRDKWLLSQGVFVFRIANRQFFDLEQHPYVDEIAQIVALCEERAGRAAFP